MAPGTTVLLYAGEEPEPETGTVPELTGLRYSEAREALGGAGLFIRSDSTILADADTVRVAFQSLTPGTKVSLGTVVEVTLVNEDDEVYGIY